MDPIRTRLARPSDARAVADYHQRCFEDTFATQLQAGDFGPPDLVGTIEQLRSWFQPRSGFETHVVAVDETPIAHFTLHKHHLVHLFVSPNHQNAGLGRLLLDQAERLFFEAGHVGIELHTRVENTRAIRFYQRAGWTMTNDQIRTIEHGIDYHEHILVKQLRPTA